MVTANEREAGGAERRVRSVILGFTDPDTGEEVVVDLRGSAGFLQGIERHGFVVLRDGGPASEVAGSGADRAPGRRTGA